MLIEIIFVTTGAKIKKYEKVYSDKRLSGTTSL